jgi:hypothetical protein
MRKNKALTYRANKFRSKRTEYNSVWYASKAEAARAAELDLLLKAGQITDWIGQPTVRLGVPENVYRPDFLVIVTGIVSAIIPPMISTSCWYEDIKGAETPKFRRDKKLWQAYGRLPLVIRRGGVEVERIIPEGRTHGGDKT